MPSPPLTNSFEGGTNTTAISAANSGGSSGDAFTAVLGTSLTFSNVQEHAGSLSMLGDATTLGTNYVEWSGLGSLTSAVYFRWYMYISAAPPTNRHYMCRLMTAAAGSCAFLRIMSTGEMSGADAGVSGYGGEGSIDVSTATWVRMEAKIVPSTTVGQIHWRLYNSPEAAVGSFTEENDSGAALALGANVGAVRFGSAVASPATPYVFYIDDIAVSTTDWIGPVSVAGETPVTRYINLV